MFVLIFVVFGFVLLLLRFDCPGQTETTTPLVLDVLISCLLIGGNMLAEQVTIDSKTIKSSALPAFSSHGLLSIVSTDSKL